MEENRNEELSQEAQETETTEAEAQESVQEPGQETGGQQEPGGQEEAQTETAEDERDSGEELTDRVQRQMAEFDNYRKRTDKEKAAMFEVGAKSVIEKMLTTVDSFERGLMTVSEEQKEDPFVQGMEKVYRQMMTVLEGIGVKPIEAKGQQFDPQYHNAVMHVEDEEVGENIVVEEFQKGYLYRDSVVRHSMVKVAN